MRRWGKGRNPGLWPGWAPILVALLHPDALHATTNKVAAYGDLPPPPRHVDLPHDQRLELELLVNGMRTLIVASVHKQRDRFLLRTEDLRQAGLLVETRAETIFLDSLEGVRADYDVPRQQLHLTVSPEYLPAQRLGGPGEAFAPARYATGALLNYDLYVAGGAAPTQASLWHEARTFGPLGIFSTSGAARIGPGKDYVRFDSYWRWSDERRMTTVEAGDLVTRTLPWAPAVRLGGVQLSRDFSVRPDIVTYPLPEFSGSAALPSTVELLVNGHRMAGGAIRPGPFALDALPSISGYGEANLIVTDMHGRSVATSIPFYVSNSLLRPGLTDYAVAVGSFRRNYGRASFDYHGMAASAAARHGVTDALTLEVRAEAADNLRLAGGGAVVRLGTWGTVNASYSRSFGHGHDGDQLTFGYDYQVRAFSIGLRHSRQSSFYADLGLLDRPRRGGRERFTSASAALSLGTAGTIGLGYFDIRRQYGEDARLANAAWSLPLDNGMRLHADVSREFRDRTWSGALSLSIALGRRGGTASGGVLRDHDGNLGVRGDISRPVPVEGGFGWNASAFSQEGRSPYMRGDVIWRGQPIQLRAGAFGRNSLTGWFGATGSLVFTDNHIMPANRVSDAFVVVNTDGEAGIPVRYENQLMGETGRHGRLLIPAVSPYYPARYDIDTLSLPANVHTPLVTQRVAVVAGAGHVLHFPVRRTTTARAVVKDGNGNHLPAGAVATINGRHTTYVGWDGLLFIEQAGAENRVEISLPDGGTCAVAFKVAPGGDGIINLGELICGP